MDTVARGRVLCGSAQERERLEPPSREINPLIRLPRENPPDLLFHPCHGGMSGIVNVQSLSRFLHGWTLNDLSRALDRMERYPGPVSSFLFGDGYLSSDLYIDLYIITSSWRYSDKIYQVSLKKGKNLIKHFTLIFYSYRNNIFLRRLHHHVANQSQKATLLKNLFILARKQSVVPSSHSNHATTSLYSNLSRRSWKATGRQTDSSV